MQRVLGSLVEVGIDAFDNFPGILDEKSAAGRAVSGFLNSIKDLNFETEEVEVLARSLFISAVESIGKNPDLLGADEKVETLIRAVSSGLIQDITAKIKAVGDNLPEREQVERWGNLVLRSVLSNIGETVLSNPKSIGIDDPAKQALVSSVGTSILGVILEEEHVKLRSLFSRQGLDQVVKASLITVAEYPDLIIDDNERLQKIISNVALGLASNEHILSKDMFPEAVRLVLEKTAQNAEFLWPEGFKDPNKHILVIAAVDFLNQFSSLPQSGQSWRPAFSKSMLTNLLDVVLEETIQNPVWVAELDFNDQTVVGKVTRVALDTLFADPPKKTVLGETTRIALDILKTIPAERLSLETGAQILRSIIQAVSKRLDFLELLERANEKHPAIAAALKPIITALVSEDLDPKILWAMARGEVLSSIIDTALEVLAQIGITPETIDQILATLEQAKQAILSGGRWTLDDVLAEIKNLANATTV
ncbi:MAG: hypothetical protein KTR29_01350 [Rhodothermaceae bacterium]|nr:hypothetical protein [Rhodothermaceae bacterium]